ncbi:MAG: response regulator, partial [Chitinophagia bacterium]|nr:response regulator [Chitinophagia bacterium]
TIKLSGERLLGIINEILDFSKIEAGKIQLESVDFDIRALLSGVQDMLLFKAEEKNIELRIEVANSIPQRLVGDPTRLSQVLINLAGNAIKFTDNGYVEIKATELSRNNRINIHIDVTDTGIGIAPEHLSSIFDSFTQAGNDVTRKFGGTGLGLTISKQLTTLMGGDLSVTSTLGKGSVFSFVVPLGIAEHQEIAAETGQLTESALHRLNSLSLLLAEDNEFNLIVACETLKERLPDVTIDVAVNGKEALEKVQRNKYDLILMDVVMPVMDGLTATTHIRALPEEQGGAVPIIAMTANVLQEDVQLYRTSGMNEYVSKPFQIDELLQKMDQLLGEDDRSVAPNNRLAVAPADSPATVIEKEQLPSSIPEDKVIRPEIEMPALRANSAARALALPLASN